MNRSVFLSAGGDPFISLLGMKFWKERWYDEVDKFYICYNNHSAVPSDVISEFASRVVKDPKVHFIYHPRGIGNGMPITEMTKIADTELVMLMEDDGFVFESKAVNEQFQLIESDYCDAVGSERMSCGPEIAEASREKYKLDYSGYGDRGPNYWPNFFFIRRSDLLKTDLNFASKTFNVGEYSKELDHTFKEITHGDTMVWVCIQLRALGLRFINVPQHHADPYEAEHMAEHMGNWHESQQPFRWIHGGSLATSWGGYLNGTFPTATDESSIREIETRCAFWIIASDAIDGFDEFKRQYKEGIQKLITGAELDEGRINKKVNIYRKLMRL